MRFLGIFFYLTGVQDLCVWYLWSGLEWSFDHLDAVNNHFLVYEAIWAWWQPNERTNNQVILEQACSCPVRRQSFATSWTSSPSLPSSSTRTRSQNNFAQERSEPGLHEANKSYEIILDVAKLSVWCFISLFQNVNPSILQIVMVDFLSWTSSIKHTLPSIWQTPCIQFHSCAGFRRQIRPHLRWQPFSVKAIT